MQETRVQSLGQEDLVEKEVATHSSILAWKIPWTEEPGRLYSPWGRKELDMTERLHFFTSKPLTVWVTTNCGKLLKRQEYQTTLPDS